mmetsp:Transcript_59591/g.118097  ORF Transcript_59591/g.118097 Transcript_59591/m.118097 type:complete len:84 (+) Transcript_59591:51-302(+)
MQSFPPSHIGLHRISSRAVGLDKEATPLSSPTLSPSSTSACPPEPSLLSSEAQVARATLHFSVSFPLERLEEVHLKIVGILLQ